MPPISAALITGGAGLLGGLAGDIFGSSGQQATNAMNMQIAQMNNQFNAQQAQLTRNFQAQQSDTAMQRRVQDLKAAGLNPLLAVGQQGASSMPGATASSVGLPNIQNPNAPFSQLGGQLSGAANAATNAYQTAKQSDLLDAQTDNARMDAMRKAAELPYSGPQAAATVQNLNQVNANLVKEGYKIGEQGDLTREQVTAQMQDNEFRNEVIPWLVKAQQYETQAKQYGLPSLAANAEFWSSPMGKYIPMLQQALLPGSQVVANAAGSLKDVIGALLQVIPSVVGRAPGAVLGPSRAAPGAVGDPASLLPQRLRDLGWN